MGGSCHQGVDPVLQKLQPQLVGSSFRLLHEVVFVADIGHDGDLPVLGDPQGKIVNKLGHAGGQEDAVRIFPIQPGLQIPAIPGGQAPHGIPGQTPQGGFILPAAVQGFVPGLFIGRLGFIGLDFAADLLPLYHGLQGFLIRHPVVGTAVLSVGNGGIDIQLAQLPAVKLGKQGQEGLSHAALFRHRIMADDQYFHRSFRPFPGSHPLMGITPRLSPIIFPDGSKVYPA